MNTIYTFIQYKLQILSACIIVELHWMHHMMAFQKQVCAGNQGLGADGQHQATPHWFFWSWNANSGDTGEALSPLNVRITQNIHP